MLFTNRPLTIGFSVAVSILFCFPVLEIRGQVQPSEVTTPVQYANAIAAITGRPIFAVAGKST